MHGWVWLALGLVLIVVEIAAAGFFVLWFAIGALIVSWLVWLWPDQGLASQILAWAGLSTLMTLAWFKLL